MIFVLQTQLKHRYTKMYERLARSLSSGQFYAHSAAQQQHLVQRLQRYEHQLHRYGIVVASVSALFLANLPNASAQRLVGSEFQVNTYTTGHQTNAKVASDANGNFAIVWAGVGVSDNTGIYAQRYSNTGSKIGSEFKVNSSVTGNQIDPSIAMDSDGDFVIVWDSDSEIHAQRYSNSGAIQGFEFQVNTYTTEPQRKPSVAMDSGGAFAVAWESYQQDGGVWGIYAQRYNNAGARVGSEFKVNTTTTAEQTTSSIAMDSDGDFVITWQSYGQDRDRYGIYAQRYNNAGARVGTEFQVNTYTSNEQGAPSVAMDSDGDFVIAWQSYQQDGSDFGIYAQRYNNTGARVGNEFKVNTRTAVEQTSPSVATDSDGDFVITWESYLQDGSLGGVYGQRYNSNGVAQAAEFKVNTYIANSQGKPSVAMDSDGDFIITWQSDRQDGSNNGIYAQRYALTSAVIDIVSATTITVQPTLVADLLRVEGTTDYQIFNTAGQLVLQSVESQLNVVALPRGVYFLRPRGGQAQPVKFVKQ